MFRMLDTLEYGQFGVGVRRHNAWKRKEQSNFVQNEMRANNGKIENEIAPSRELRSVQTRRHMQNAAHTTYIHGEFQGLASIFGLFDSIVRLYGALAAAHKIM